MIKVKINLKQTPQPSQAKISRINNFDLLRLVLASLVFFYHAYVLTADDSLKLLKNLFQPLWELAVPGFFVISGFLIFMSYENSESLKSYGIKRARRILPAYFFVVIFCAIAGVLVSTLPWNEYFGQTWLKYLICNLTFLNFLQPSLPGVFENNPLYSAVDGSLWTIKIEVMFYLAVPLLAILFNRSHRLAAIVILYVLSYLYFEGLTALASHTGNGMFIELAKQLPGQLSFFLSGALIYYYFDFFKQHSKVLVISAVALHIVSSAFDFSFFMPATLAIIILYLAFFTPPINVLTRHGDFSYGIYIYHYPIIQLLIALGLFQFSPYLAFAVAAVAVIISAVLSWHWIEKPVLLKRKPEPALQLDAIPFVKPKQ